MRFQLILSFAVLTSFASAATLQSENVPLPTGVYSVGNLVDEFRAQLRTKIDELHKNFYPHLSGPTIQFFNDDGTNCPLGPKTPPSKPVAAISVSEKRGVDSLTQVVTYTSCNQQVLFQESYRSTGNDLKPTPVRDLWYGLGNLTLSDNETEKIYTLSNSKNKETIRVRIFRTNTGVHADFWLQSRNIFRYEDYQSPEESRVRYFLESFTFENLENGHVDRWRYNFGGFSSLRSVLKKNGQIFYYINEPGPVPFIKFNQTFADFVLGASFDIFRSVVKYGFINYLPETKFVKSGISSTRLLDELRLNLTRLTAKIELNEVRNFILQLITSVDNEYIVDKRPPK